MAPSQSKPTPNTSELSRVVTRLANGAPLALSPLALAPIAPDPLIPVKSIPENAITVIDEDSGAFGEKFAVTAAFLNGAGGERTPDFGRAVLRIRSLHQFPSQAATGNASDSGRRL